MGDKKTHDKFRGVDVPTITYFCGKDSWKINPEGHLPKISDKINALVKDFEKITDDLKSGKMIDMEGQKQAQGIVQKILEIALLPKGVGNPKGFDFDEALGNYGYRTMDGVAIDMKRFLIEIGGAEEAKLYKQRSSEVNASGSLGFET